MDQKMKLISLIQARASVQDIGSVLAAGAIANDIEVIQALEEAFSDEVWLSSVMELPALAEAWQLRKAADQAAFDLSSAIEDGDLDAAAEALATMREAGDTADMTSSDLSFLGEAVACHASLPMIQLLVDAGADPDGFSNDAREELEKMPRDEWRKNVEQFFKTVSMSD